MHAPNAVLLKNKMPVVKIKNGGCFQDGVESVFIFHPIFSKMIIFQFLFFYLLWVKKKI
jgi:hypothetical protein